ncbi:hypothetical protein CRG98_003763 [Punica granatum]|uniref:Uncharacterized protein n=1 Tax=Punica granatum TaxID=22663 RepID=A0A2I0L578_PUNGR|nr:hypothetical protein CRG98_003763 [Punica granatum]
MGVTRSGRVYENSVATYKGKAPPVEIEAIPGIPPTPPKKVTEEEAEAFMKIIKASEYKIVEQMAKSPAHISLLALLLSSEPYREALLRVLTAAQVPKGKPPDRIEETMNVDLTRVRPSKSTVQAFDGSQKEVNGEIDLLIDVGPLLLGRPWIHSAGAVPSSLHQKLKFIIEEKLITVKGKEDYAIYKETAVPYISVGNDENLPFHSFKTISVIRDYGKVGPTRADPRRDHHPRHLAAHYGKVNRGLLVPPLSHFFLGPPHIVGDTLDGPSSDSIDAPDTLPTVYAVTEEIPSGVHIRLAQENDELNNWTSVPRYSAVIANV